ncbi:hypothetical protein ABPG73_010039 [Tetrahymena malaccensis]
MNQNYCKSTIQGGKCDSEQKREEYNRFKENCIQFQVQMYLKSNQKLQGQDKNKSTQSQKQQNITQRQLDFSCFQVLFSHISSKNQLKLPTFQLDFAKKTCFENKVYDSFYQSEDVMQDCSKCKKLLNMRYILKDFSQYLSFRANKIDKYMFLRNDQIKLICHDVKNQKKSKADAQKSNQIQQVVQNFEKNIQDQQNTQSDTRKQDFNKLLQKMEIEEIRNTKVMNQQKQDAQNQNSNPRKDDLNLQHQNNHQYKPDKVEQLNQIQDNGYKLNQNIQKQANSQRMEEINQNQKIFQSLALQIYFNKFYTNQNDFSDHMEIERVSSKQKKKKININDDFKEIIINLLNKSSQQNQKCSTTKKIKFELVFLQNKKIEKLHLFDSLKINLQKNYQRKTNLSKCYQDQNEQSNSKNSSDQDAQVSQNQNEISIEQQRKYLNEEKRQEIYYEWLEGQKYQQKPQKKEISYLTNKPGSDLCSTLKQKLSTPIVSQTKILKQSSINDFYNKTSCNKTTVDKSTLDIEGYLNQQNLSTRSNNEIDFDLEKCLYDQKKNTGKFIKQNDEQLNISNDSVNQQNVSENFQIDETTTNKKQFENHDFQSDKQSYKVRDYIIDDKTLMYKQNDNCQKQRYNVYEYHAQSKILDNSNLQVQKNLDYDQYSEISFSKLSQSPKKNIFNDLLEQPQSQKISNNQINSEQKFYINTGQCQGTKPEIDILKTQNIQYGQIENGICQTYCQNNSSEIPYKQFHQQISQKLEQRDSSNRDYASKLFKQNQNCFDDSVNQEQEIHRCTELKNKSSKQSLKVKIHQQNNSDIFNLTNLSEKIKKRMASGQKNSSNLISVLETTQKSNDKSQNRFQINKSDQQDNNYSFQLVKFINSFKQKQQNQI